MDFCSIGQKKKSLDIGANDLSKEGGGVNASCVGSEENSLMDKPTMYMLDTSR